jgi:hypothetical protein
MRDEHLPELYTDRDLTRARRKAKAVGWVQGGGAVLAVGFVYSIIGWLPTLLVLGVVAYGVYRLLRSPKAPE